MKFSDIPQKFDKYRNYVLLGLVGIGAYVIGSNFDKIFPPKPDSMHVIIKNKQDKKPVIKKAEKEKYTTVALEELVENPEKYEGKIIEIEAEPSWVGLDRYVNSEKESIIHFSLEYKRRWIHGAGIFTGKNAKKILKEMNAEIYDGDEEKIILIGEYQKDPNSGGYLLYMGAVKVPNKHKGAE